MTGQFILTALNDKHTIVHSAFGDRTYVVSNRGPAVIKVEFTQTQPNQRSVDLRPNCSFSITVRSTTDVVVRLTGEETYALGSFEVRGREDI